jgi:hypothetical protein
VVSFTLAAACWLAAGPGGVTVQALLACRHHAMHQSHPGHGTSGTPSDGPCFCGEMIGGSDLAVSVAVPAPPIAAPLVLLRTGIALPQSLFPLPPSPALPPASPPPIRLG